MFSCSVCAGLSLRFQTMADKFAENTGGFLIYLDRSDLSGGRSQVFNKILLELKRVMIYTVEKEWRAV